MVETPIAFLPGLGLLTPKLFTKVLANERMRIEMARLCGSFPARSPALLNLVRIGRQLAGLKLVNDSVRPGTAGGFSKAESRAHPRVDQRDLAYGELTVQDPRQTKSGTIPSLFVHGLPVERRAQDVLTLP